MTPVDQRVAIKESAHSSCEDPVVASQKYRSLKNR
jgi:hypothetical protein